MARANSVTFGQRSRRILARARASPPRRFRFDVPARRLPRLDGLLGQRLRDERRLILAFERPVAAVSISYAITPSA